MMSHLCGTEGLSLLQIGRWEFHSFANYVLMTRRKFSALISLVRLSCFFLQYSAFDIGFAIGNGSYMPHDEEELRKNDLWYGNQLMETVNHRYKTEIFPSLENMEIDQREIGILKTILFFNGDATLTPEGQTSCEKVVSAVIEAWFEYQRMRFPSMTTLQLVSRQSKILLILPKMMHVWQTEHDVYLMYSVFHGVNLDGIPMELMSNKGLQAKK